jgi:hypothetical protein
MANQVHVAPHPRGGWDVKRDSSEKASVHTPRKPEAVARAREISINEKLELVIHDKDGKIAERASYGNNQHHPEG